MIRGLLAVTFAVPALVALGFHAQAALAAKLDYQLESIEVAAGVYAVLGKDEHFSRANGGNIVNTGFIVAPRGVVVIDTGPSLRYGRQLRALIERVTPLPVIAVYNTHLHPDHVLGNQAFADVGVSALQGTTDGLRQDGEDFTTAMYVLAGEWMRGTELALPTRPAFPGTVDHGGRAMRLLALDGHSSADLALLDVETRVLFAGDLAFRGRAPTTPHADLSRWQRSLAELEALAPRVVVPGHGAIDTRGASIAETRAYLAWLDSAFATSASQGFDMVEVMQLTPPPPLDGLAVLPEEFHRSVAHLFADYERAVLGNATPN